MKLSAAASARIGLGTSIGMILLSAFLLCADPAGPALWLLFSAIPLASPLLIGNRKHRIYTLSHPAFHRDLPRNRPYPDEPSTQPHHPATD